MKYDDCCKPSSIVITNCLLQQGNAYLGGTCQPYMCQNRVMHIWVGLYVWQNRYGQIKDKRWDRTCGKRGTNQKVGPYMWENVPPCSLNNIFELCAIISNVCWSFHFLLRNISQRNLLKLYYKKRKKKNCFPFSLINQ